MAGASVDDSVDARWCMVPTTEVFALEQYRKQPSMAHRCAPDCKSQNDESPIRRGTRSVSQALAERPGFPQRAHHRYAPVAKAIASRKNPDPKEREGSLPQFWSKRPFSKTAAFEASHCDRYHHDRRVQRSACAGLHTAIAPFSASATVCLRKLAPGSDDRVPATDHRCGHSAISVARKFAVSVA